MGRPTTTTSACASASGWSPATSSSWVRSHFPVWPRGLPLSWAVALTLPLVMSVNLVVLARTRRFERYVVVLIVTVTLFPAFIEVVLGGLGGASAAFLFAFLGPVFAILALGPQRATAWFVFFLVVMVVVIVIDPLVSSTIEPQPYPLRLVFYAANLAVPLAIIFVLLRYTDLRRRQAEARSEELLTNAIPVSIAARLKRGEQRIADAYPDTTVLFADLVDFTPWAQRTDPARGRQLPRRPLQTVRLAGRDRGRREDQDDRRLVHGGRRRPRAARRPRGGGHGLARGMLDGLADADADLGLPLELRIGLASGSVVGGVIGQQRILFDLWGDTVNLASRMESSGVPGRIQVAPSTRDLLLGSQSFEEREPVEVKGLGRMTTYLVVDMPARVTRPGPA